jgi:tetraacyldisaccharide-1-P 4'-kinase
MAASARRAAIREFPDHRAYGCKDTSSLAAAAQRLGVAAAVCTEKKDLVKLAADHLGQRPL